MPVRWLIIGALLHICFLSATAVKNKVTGVDTNCEENIVNVTLKFENEFHGLVHSKGSDCVSTKGQPGATWITVTLDPRACALRISKENGALWYSGSLQVQMSETVLQATDPVVSIRCSLDSDMLTIKARMHRSGRKIDGGDDKSSGRAWLEVRGSAISTFTPSNSLSVGEHTTLSVYTLLPDGISGRPVDCKVDDGRGTSQKLSDEHGCSTDPTLVPALRSVEHGPSGSIWATAFPAFSFPDTQLVHYTCQLMICSGACPEYQCEEEDNSTRNSRDFQVDHSEDSVLDFVELYNSVEVTAPNIELGYLRKELMDPPPGANFDDGWVCLSGPRVALVFATLGGMFLAAVLATLLLLIRHRRRYLRRHPYGLYT